MMPTRERLSAAPLNHGTNADRARLVVQHVIASTDELGRRWRLSDSQTRKQLCWRAVTAPVWLGSEIPAPSLPTRRVPIESKTPGTPAGVWLDRRVRSLERRYGRAWVAAAAIRGLWLGLGVALIWVLIALIGIVSLPSQPLLVGLPIAGLILGTACGQAIRPSAGRIVEMMDRTFHLDERLTTAVDTLRSPGDRSYVTQLQLADAANTLDNIAADVPRPIHAPLREIWFLAVLLTALLTGLFAWVPGTPLPRVREEAVPVFVSASERLTAQQELPTLSQPPAQAPTVSEVQQQAQSSNQAQSDLDLLGGALKNHPSTSPAADAIADGDYRGAADIIRTAAGDADAMSQQERNALADDLDASADQMSDSNPELAAATHKAADDLRGGGEQSGDGLLDVADEVDAAASQVVPQEELDQDLAEAEASESQAGSGTSGEGSSGETATQQDASQAQSQPGPSDPGKGVAANPGVVEEQQPGAQSGDSSGSQQGSASQGGSSEQSGAGSAPQERGSGGSGAEGDQQGADASGEQASGSGKGEANQSQASQPDSTGEEAAQGTGAGSGSGSEDAEPRSPEDQQVENPSSEGANPQTDPNADGRAVDNPPPSSSDSGDGSGNSGTVRNNGDQSLPLQGTSDEGVQSGNQSGTSSTGSGAGQGTASGDGAQGSVGVAGPDSNIVPEDVRDSVGDYFDGTGSQP